MKKILYIVIIMFIVSCNNNEEGTVKQAKYIQTLNKLRDYNIVANWFSKNPPEFANKNGHFYKMFGATIIENETTTRTDLSKKDENNRYHYCCITEDSYYLLEFKIIYKKAKCMNIRRISRGWGKEKMHDIEYNKEGLIIKENFISEVNPDLYRRNGNLFLEFQGKIGDKDVTNIINLGRDIFKEETFFFENLI